MDGRTDEQINVRDDPITRYPQRTFKAGHKNDFVL